MRPMRKGTNTEIDNMVFRIMRPTLWRCLKVSLLLICTSMYNFAPLMDINYTSFICDLRSGGNKPLTLRNRRCHRYPCEEKLWQRRREDDREVLRERRHFSNEVAFPPYEFTKVKQIWVSEVRLASSKKYFGGKEKKRNVRPWGCTLPCLVEIITWCPVGVGFSCMRGVFVRCCIIVIERFLGISGCECASA